MNEKPRDLHDHIFNLSAAKDLIFTGLVMGSLAYINYILFAVRHGVVARNYIAGSALYASATTLTYVTICVFQYVNVLIRRTPERTLSAYLFTNKQLWVAIGISLFCVLNIVYNPFVHKLFSTYYLDALDWLFILGSAIIYFMIRESYKFVSNKKIKI